MGFPMIQVFMIAARQVSKPVADAVIRYGKNHPLFRQKILIPIGKSIVRLTARLKMKRLGLGETPPPVNISENAALEQASDFVQQLVLFMYSLGVFSGYYFYTKLTSPDSIKPEDFNLYRTTADERIAELERRMTKLEQTIATLAITQANYAPSSTATKSDLRAQRLTSLPVDEAAKVVLKDGREFLVVRRGSSVGIEDARTFEERGGELKFTKRDLKYSPPRKGIIGSAERFVCHSLGQWTE